MITYPLNGINYNASDAELYNCTRTSGVFAMDDFSASVTGNNNSVTIGQGVGWLRNQKFAGKVIALKENKVLDLGLPDNTYNRIDAIVIQFDGQKNATDIIVKKGKAGSKPVAPAVTREANKYELHLYHIYRKTGQAVIRESDITDLRADPKYCGQMYDNVTPKEEITPINKGGTGAKTKEQAMKNFGVVDYIIESGEKNGWKYDLWASGKATCSYIYSTTTRTQDWTTWGSLTLYYFATPSHKYPVNFKERPNETVTGHIAGSNAWMVCSTNTQTDSSTATFYAPTYDTEQRKLEVHYKVEGRWK